MGRIVQRVENIQGETITWDYSYDELGRLIEVKRNGTVVEVYTYDANGNRISETNTFKGVTDMAYTYSIEDHLLTAGSDTYQFDSDGFLTQKTTSEGTTTYKYSSRGELLEVVLPDGTVISYDYDPMGRRIAKRINGQVVEKYLWSGRIRLLAVYDNGGNLAMRFNYADGRMPVSMEYSGTTYYLLYDQVGSLRAVVDSSGLLVKRIDYDSFGDVILDTDPSFKIPIGFAGGLYDPDTGFVRFGVRDYDPAIGRWTAKDPIDFAGGSANLFEYVQGDPVNWVDPWGLFEVTSSMTDTWINYGEYGANWSAFRHINNSTSNIHVPPSIKDFNHQLQDTASQILAEELAEKYISKSFALWLKRMKVKFGSSLAFCYFGYYRISRGQMERLSTMTTIQWVEGLPNGLMERL